MQFSLPMNQPLVVIPGYNTESDVAAARAFVKRVPDADDPAQTHGDILCEAIYSLRDMAQEPCLMDDMVVYPEVDTTLNLWAVIPEMETDYLPEAVAELGFLGLFACAWRRVRGDPIPPGKLHVTVLRASSGYMREYSALREHYRHEAPPVPDYVWVSPDTLLHHMRETYTFPCKRWWE